LKELPVHVSVSIGCAVYPDDGLHLTDLLRAADTKLYHHKNVNVNES
jgi:GGDEF domain-containing protein